MKYIVFENIYTMFSGWNYKRTEIKTDKELKEYLFKNKNNLSNIEIFNKSDKCKIEFNVIIGGKNKLGDE